MSLEDDTNNLSELTPISSNHRVQKTIQNSTITTVDSSSSISLKTFIEQQVAMFSSIDKFTDTLCDQLKNLTFIVKYNVNVEQTSRGSSSTTSQERSLVVKNRHKETRKQHHDEVSFLKILLIQMIMIRPIIKALELTLSLLYAVISSTIEMMIK